MKNKKISKKDYALLYYVQQFYHECGHVIYQSNISKIYSFKEEEFWWASDSGLKLNSFLSDGKLYKFPAKTVEHLNQLVEAINTIVHH